MFLCVSVRSCPRTSIRGSWGSSSSYIPCRRVGSEAFICICSCRPSVTTTACESRPVSERQQLKAKVVFVHSCQMQSKTHFQSLLCSPHLQPTPPSLVAQITAAPHHIFHVIYSIECFCWNLLLARHGFKTGAFSEHLFFWFVFQSGLGGMEKKIHRPAKTTSNGFSSLLKMLIDTTGLNNTFKPNSNSTDVPNWCLSH